ncbi:MAG: hypothetical protein R3F39_02660 [Myxococcota bacterium]
MPRLYCAIASLWALAACQELNHPPSLVLVPDRFVLVGERLEIQLIGADPDGDTLEFAVEGLPESATITPQSPVTATLTWSPTITDTAPGGTVISARAIVRDGHGGESSQAFSVSVFPIFGTPSFDLPAGIALNLAREETLELAVRVKDDDSTAVALSLTEAPDGAVLSKSGPKSAILFWRPTAAQREQTVHRIIFGADDADNAPVAHTLLVVLLNAEAGAGCSGTPPRVEHTPPADHFFSEGGLAFEARVTDVESSVASVEVGFTLGDPEAGLESLTLTRQQEKSPLFGATLKLEALPPGGALLRYRVLARDNDDPVGLACDQATRLPKTGWYSVAVYPPDAPDGTCLDDDSEPDDTPAAATALSPGSYPDRRLCPDSPDTALISVAAGERLAVVLTRAAAHGLPTLTLRDSTGTLIAEATGDGPTLRVEDTSGLAGSRVLRVTPAPGGAGLSYSLDVALTSVPCDDDSLEPNDTPAAAVPLSPGLWDTGVLCAGDEDWFRFSLAAGERFDVTLDHDVKLGDLDLELRDAATGALLDAAATLSSLEILRYTAPAATTVTLGVLGYQGAGNAYRLQTEIAAAGTSCDDDILGYHADPALAATLMSGLYENLTCCPDAPDWFSVELNGGETLTVLAETESAPIDLAIFTSPTAEPVATGTAEPGGLGEASFDTTEPGRVYYRVSSAAPTAYVLLQDIADPAGPCAPDRFEPNDTAQTAKALPPGVHTQLRLCNGDDTDAFTVTLDAFALLTVLTSHATGGYTDLQVLDPAGKPLEDALDPGQGAELTLLAPVSGEYTLLVMPFEAQGLAYDLSALVN